MMRGPFPYVVISCLLVVDISETSLLVAISQRSGHIFLTPTTNQELSSPLDIHNVNSPSFVEADLSSPLIYWSDTSSKNKDFIGCYNFFTHGETVVAELPFGARVVGLAVDGRRGLAYYADASDGSIEAVNTETGASSTVIRGLNASSLCCLDVNGRTGELYWKENVYGGVGEPTREGIYAFKYPNAGSSLVPVKRLLYSEHKPLSIKAVAVESTGAYVFWCSTGTDGAQTLLKYDLSGTEIFNLPFSGIQGNCTSLTADAVFLYMVTSFENGSNAIYAMPLQGPTTYFIIVQPNEATHFKDITVTDVAAAAKPLTTTSAATTGPDFPTPAPTPASLVIGLTALVLAFAAWVALLLCHFWKKIPNAKCPGKRDKPVNPHYQEPSALYSVSPNLSDIVPTPVLVSNSRPSSVMGLNISSTTPFNGFNRSHWHRPSDGTSGPAHPSANLEHAAGRPTDTPTLLPNERMINDTASGMQSGYGGNGSNELATSVAAPLVGEVQQASAQNAVHPDATLPKVVATAVQRK